MAWDDSRLLLMLFSEPRGTAFTGQPAQLSPTEMQNPARGPGGADRHRRITKAVLSWGSRNESHTRQMSWQVAGNHLAGNLTEGPTTTKVGIHRQPVKHSGWLAGISYEEVILPQHKRKREDLIAFLMIRY